MICDPHQKLFWWWNQGGLCGRRAKNRNTCGVLVRKPKEKRSRGWPVHWLERDIKMDLKVIGWQKVDLIGVTG